jgi:hypothetical protein
VLVASLNTRNAEVSVVLWLEQPVRFIERLGGEAPAFGGASAIGDPSCDHELIVGATHETPRQPPIADGVLRFPSGISGEIRGQVVAE